MKELLTPKRNSLRIVKVLVILGMTFLAFSLGIAWNWHNVANASTIVNQAKPGVVISGSQVLSATANNIEVRATNFRKEGDFLKTDVCYTMLDSSDWIIGSASLRYGKAEISDYTTDLIERHPPESGQPGFRCDTLSFEVPNTSDLSNFTVTIQKLAAEPRETEFCSAYLKKVNEKMAERNSGIKVDCVKGESTYGLKVISKPSNLSQEDAEAVAFSDEFYSTSGPWKFTTGLK